MTSRDVARVFDESKVMLDELYKDEVPWNIGDALHASGTMSTPSGPPMVVAVPGALWNHEMLDRNRVVTLAPEHK